jgi:hypothetical protein
MNRPVALRALFPLLLALGAGATGCGTTRATVEAEIGRARVAYFRAEAGPATIVVPDELRDAKASLDAAERAFVKRPDDPRTADLAYIAARRSELVESHAGLLLARRRKAEALRELRAEEATKEARR